MKRIYTIDDLNFVYPKSSKPALEHVNLEIKEGQFLIICGASGCGKSTLLRHLKSALAPYGERSGSILFEGVPLEKIDARKEAQRIGFVLQDPERQVVTDKVWHELAFGLESLGYKKEHIRLKVAEIASFFGIQNWFHKDVSELSGGQKQILNLASVMAMEPRVLILDEPTSQLDPIAAREFLMTLKRINDELGTTIIMTEHRLEEALPLCDCLVVMHAGTVLKKGTPREVGGELKKINHPIFEAMPTAMQIYGAVEAGESYPLTIKEGRQWLKVFLEAFNYNAESRPKLNKSVQKKECCISLEEVWFRYEKKGPDIIKGLSCHIPKGAFYAILGGNGTGKSTTLSLISGLNKPYRGTIKRTENRSFLLPQNPETLFVRKSVQEELEEVLGKNKEDSQLIEMKNMITLCKLESLLNRHPYDLSGGEKQRVALAKLLLLKPQILLLDEPTKGLDIDFKNQLGDILQKLQRKGTTIIMVSHDVDFCARYADYCAMFFDGSIISEAEPRSFFGGNSFYTTSANRMTRGLIEDVVTVQEVIKECIDIKKPKSCQKKVTTKDDVKDISKDRLEQKKSIETIDKKQACETYEQDHQKKEHLSKRTWLALIMVMVAIPITIWLGIEYFNDRKYYFISLLVILESMLPFAIIFEGRKPKARELIVIAVMCSIGVVGRLAVFMIPQFKPVVALVIITGVCLGAESGFLTGALIAFMSNFFFGQGPWTPWQMFALGSIGFLSGVLFKKKLLPAKKLPLCLYGAIVTLCLYGGIMNPASVLMMQHHPKLGAFIVAYINGLPFDLVHAASTVIFLFLTAEPLIEKLERVKSKYGLLQ